MSTRSMVREDGLAQSGELVLTKASGPNGRGTSVLTRSTSSGDCEEAGILEPLRKHIQIRRAEGADDEDILREVWKWWNGDGGPGAWGGGPVEVR